MSSEIESLDNVGLLDHQAWHKLGVVIKDNLTAVQAAERFGITWPVDQDRLIAVSSQAHEWLERAKHF